MDLPAPKAIEDLLGNISIAAVRSWLKLKGVASSAASRDALTARIRNLLEQKCLSWPELQIAAIQMEESSSKRVALYDISKQAATKAADVEKRARKINKSFSTEACLAPSGPKEPTLVYLSRTDREIRAKFAETQYSIEVNLKRQTASRVPVTRVVVAVARPETGVLQIRFDSPEDIHSHVDAHGRPRADIYRGFYLSRIGEMLGYSLQALDLRPILKGLTEATPRPFQFTLNRVRTPADSRMRISNPGDVRDDPDWQVAQRSGGAHWAHEQGAGQWHSEASGGRLTRSIFTDINAVEGTLRFLADCHEGELEYVVARIEDLYHKQPSH
jgi:hypothetical protein